jgi:N6-L-threonylcarbamoyladenine synthase
MASTGDVAVGECLDKVARAVLPTQLLLAAKTTMYGAILEKFAFSHDPGTGPAKNGVEPGIASPGKNGYFLEDSTAKEYQAMYTTRYAYTVPKNHEDALRQNLTTWGWSFNQPLAKAGGGTKNKSLEMSFSGLMTAVERAVRFTRDPTTGKLSKLERPPEGITLEERKDMAREAMRAAFEHVASRVVLGLQQLTSENPGTAQVATVVVSGGVAANSYLRYILASMLVAHGYPDVRIVFPPVSLCTDNAAMIAWAGIEMYQAGYTDPRSIRGIRKWPLDQLLSPPQE